MRASEMLRAAAELIHTQQKLSCCLAVGQVWAENLSETVEDWDKAKFYLNLFVPDHTMVYWWGRGEREARIIALLMAAAMAEEEGN